MEKDGEILHCPNCFNEKVDLVCPHCGFQEKGSRNLLALPSTTLLNGQYIVGRVLGQGGFGITYLAMDKGLETKVAVKEYLPRDLVGRSPDGKTVSVYSEKEEDLFRYGRDRFIQEARTLAKFDHPNVVRVRSVFEENGTACLVMDYYEGMALSEYIDSLKTKGEELPFRTAVDIMLRVMDGLKEVHDKKFLHRDIKPQNIYITREGRPILLDFGAARTAVGERSMSLSVIYTPGFAPYEQYQRKGEQGPWTDVYACAATLYFLVTGVNPVDSIDRAADDSLVSPERLKPGLTDEFCQVLLKAMAVKSRERYQTIQEFQEQLAAAVTGQETQETGRSETVMQTVVEEKVQEAAVQPKVMAESTVWDEPRQVVEATALQAVQGKREDELRKAALEATRQEEEKKQAAEVSPLKGTVLETPKDVIVEATPEVRRKKKFPAIVAAVVMVILTVALGIYFATPKTGEVALANGLYKGQLKGGKPEGQGNVAYNDGSKFEGWFQSGKRQGQGKLTAADGKTVIYDGEWKDDKRHGKGLGYGRYSDRDDQAYIKYDGQWENDVKQGQAVALLYKTSGEEFLRYEGKFQNDLMEDTDAKISFANGAKYQGSISNDRFNGQGTFTFANGKVQSGWWENDHLVR